MQTLSTNSVKDGLGRSTDIVRAEPMVRRGAPLAAVPAVEASLHIDALPAPVDPWSATQDDGNPPIQRQLVPDHLNQFLGEASQ